MTDLRIEAAPPLFILVDKRCSQCGEHKPLSEFYIYADRPRSSCKDCDRKARGHYGFVAAKWADAPLTAERKWLVECKEAQAKQSRRYPRICEVCNSTYTATYDNQRTCGRACGRVIRIDTRQRKNWPLCHVRYLNCAECGEIFTSHKNRRTLCSEKCCRLHKSRQMLSRYHADPTNWTTTRKRRRLFERDGWRCRICGKQVSDTVSRNHSMRAVAGHILARATGGEWTDENMATLCYPCNVLDGVNRVSIQTMLSF